MSSDIAKAWCLPHKAGRVRPAASLGKASLRDFVAVFPGAVYTAAGDAGEAHESDDEEEVEYEEEDDEEEDEGDGAAGTRGGALRQSSSKASSRKRGARRTQGPPGSKRGR